MGVATILREIRMRQGLALAIKRVVISMPSLLKAYIDVCFICDPREGQGRDLAPFLQKKDKTQLKKQFWKVKNISYSYELWTFLNWNDFERKYDYVKCPLNLSFYVIPWHLFTVFWDPECEIFLRPFTSV